MSQWTLYQPATAGYLTIPSLSEQLRRATYPLYEFRQFVRPEIAEGKTGEIHYFNRIGRVTTLAGPIGEQDEGVPINAPVITRGTVIIKDWLAYLDVTERLERFAQFDVEEILIEALKLNLQHNLDKVVADVLKTTPLVAVPTSASALTITTNGTPSGQAGAKALTYAHIKDAVDYLRLTMQVPPYDGENYACIAHGLGVRVLHDEIGDAFMKYTTPEHFFRSEVGQLYNCRIVQTNNSDALRGSAGTGSIKTPEAIFLAQDPIVEVISVPEEIRIEPVANTMGRKKRLAWFFSGNWALTWDTPGLGEARVIYLTSA